MEKEETTGDGLFWFSVDVNIFYDPDIIRLLQRYGGDGFTILMASWCTIYGKKGYYLEWNDTTAFGILHKVMASKNISEELVSEVITYSVDKGLFDKEFFKKDNILTSKRIQKSYKITNKRAVKKLQNLFKSKFYIKTEDNEPVVTNDDEFVTNFTNNVTINDKLKQKNENCKQIKNNNKNNNKERRKKESHSNFLDFSPPDLREIYDSEFSPPLLDEIYDYAIEKHYDINPELFFSHYESQGWKIGQNPMVNWKSAVDKWVLRERADSKTITQNSTNLPKNGIKSKSKAQIQLEELPEDTVVEANGIKFTKINERVLESEFIEELTGRTLRNVIFISDFVKKFPKFEVLEPEIPENFSP